MKKNWQKFFSTFIFLATLVAPLSTFKVNAGALEDQLDEIQKQIDEIQNQKNGIQGQLDANNYTILGYNSQLSALYGEAQIYQKNIDEIELQIKQIKLTIEKINQDIILKKEEIKKKMEEIKVLEFESKDRINNSYMNFRMVGQNTDVGSSILFTPNVNQYFKTSQYKEIIQSDTNNLLVELAKLKADLEQKKKELDAKLIEQQKEQELVNIKAEDLKQKKAEVDAKMAVFYQKVAELQATSNNYNNTIAVLNQDQAYKNAQAEYIKQQIIGSFTPFGSGQFVIAGTMIGQQGCTGLCTGAHLHFMVYWDNALQEPCGHLAGGAMTCGAGGPLQSPLRGNLVYTSGFGNRCFWWGGSNYCDFHNAIDVAASPWNAPVYAAHDGYLYKGVDPYGANYIIICQTSNCNVGYKTGYWHLSSF